MPSVPIPPRYAIIADDLTGAGDVGVQFSRAGLCTRSLCDARLPFWPYGVDAVVVDTASRALPADAAYATVLRALQTLDAANVHLVYKKIDSTLRGNLGAELDAALDACGAKVAIVCPAFPANGRLLVDGVLFVDGHPVAQSAFAHDPITPVAESHLPTLLSGQSRRPIVSVSRPTTVPDLLRHLRMIAGDAGGLVVCDAQDDDDLALIVEAAQALGTGALLAGSAGLARPLAAQLAASQHRRVLVVCGSLHPLARTQVELLRTRADVWEVDADTAGAGGARWENWRAWMSRCIAAPNRTGAAVVIMTSHRSTQNSTPGAQAHAASAVIARRIAEAVASALAATSFAGVVVTGGDTLRALLAAWQATGIDLVAEIAPGIPVGVVVGGTYAGLPIVSKAGGFGAPDALVRSVQVLAQRPLLPPPG